MRSGGDVAAVGGKSTLIPPAKSLEKLRERLGADRFDLWFGANAPISLERESIVVAVPNRFYQDWLEAEFQGELSAACASAFGKAMPVRFQIVEAETVKAGRKKAKAAEPAPSAKPAGRKSKPDPVETESEPVLSEAAAPPPAESPRRSLRHSLARFIVGPPNRMAYSAIEAALADPRDGSGPIYLHGGIGVGKTHLLRGLSEGLKRRHSRLKIGCFGAEEFTNEFVDAWKKGQLPAFRKRIRALDVLLLDDVQFLAGKKATQEELFHALESIELRGGRVILTGDHHPRRIAKLQEELKSRFLGGTVAKIDPPNREMRRQIVAAKIIEKGVRAGEEVVQYIADQVRGNVRELEGAVNYLAHWNATVDSGITLAAVRDALSDVVRHVGAPLDLESVFDRICQFFHLTKARVKEKSRAKAVTEPRALVLYLLRKHSGAPYAEIGRLLGGMAHSSVLAAEKRVVARLAKDDVIALSDRKWKLRDAVEAFERELG
ncbi:MAG TPA: DnaA/Hda family protein [Planctomycetia bacterium]|nr:DnaA/Hda family protein [Planctomycetia bacterium]